MCSFERNYCLVLCFNFSFDPAIFYFLCAGLCANSAKLENIQLHSAYKGKELSLTAAYGKELRLIQPNRPSKTAKPLFIGSIPIAASIRIKHLRAADWLPVLGL
jgi:hypothetical protein